MVLVLLNWLWILLVTWIVGYVTVRALGYLGRVSVPDSIHPVLLVLTGLATATLMGNYASLFIRIHWEFQVALGLIAALLGSFYRAELYRQLLYWQKALRRMDRLPLVLFGFFFVLALVQSAGPVQVFDEGEYYLPLVRWIEQLPVVPGAGQLMDRMAYNPAHFMTNALFGQVFAYPDGLYDINGLLLVVVALFGMTGLNRLIRSDWRFLPADGLMVGVLMYPFPRLIASMDSDVPAALMGCVLWAVLMRDIAEPALCRKGHRPLLLFWLALYLSTSRPLMGVFLLIALWRLYMSGSFQKRGIITVAILAIVYIAPWLIRNYYLSGYLVYPLYWLDLFTPDWKIPVDVARSNYRYIGEFAKLGIVRFSYGFQGVSGPPLLDWLPIWWREHRTDPLGLVTIVGLPSGVLLSAAMLFLKRGGRKATSYYVAFGLAGLFLLFWFFHFPAIRFAWSWILFLGLTPWMLFIRTYHRRWLPVLRKVGLPVLFITLAVHLTKAVKSPDSGIHHLLLPAAYPVPDILSRKDLGPVDVLIVKGQQCWGIRPPCMPDYYNPGVRLRGPRLRDGFRRE